jgi:hypothetical protein
LLAIIGDSESLRNRDSFSKGAGEEVVAIPLTFLISFSTFHILDSLRVTFPARKELKQLQNILLEHFEEESFLDGRISVSVPEVAHLVPAFYTSS